MQGLKINTANSFFLNPKEDVLNKIESIVGENSVFLIV